LEDPVKNWNKNMKSFDSFDPLKAKSTAETDVAANALKREIKGILGSYVGWYDPFSELIQNALDAVDARKEKQPQKYKPQIWITVNIQENQLSVTDNGIGLDKNEFEQFLVPFFSFKSGKTRGHKGVGATYLAYGFNFIQVSTKTKNFSTTGQMRNARDWLSDQNPAGNPNVEFDDEGAQDAFFKDVDSGVSITLGFDSKTHPKDLDWIKVSDASNWLKILSIKTGLGAFEGDEEIKVTIKVIDKNGGETITSQEGIGYLWLEEIEGKKCIRLCELEEKLDALYKKKGLITKLPISLRNFDIIWELWEYAEIKEIIDFTEDELSILELVQPDVYVGYASTARLYQSFSESLGARKNAKILVPGIQIFANNMPQGEVFQVPLKRYTGRQNQVHVCVNITCSDWFYSADLGRKGFHDDIMELSKKIAEELIVGPMNNSRVSLRPNTGAPSDIVRVRNVAEWKDEMKQHEIIHPLTLENENFFRPVKSISITSVPTREQDVISLFNQLIAGGVIRGIRIMSTNERFTYDGLYRILIAEPTKNHLFDEKKNPLGILEDQIAAIQELPFLGAPGILEYKYCLDGLIEDISDGTKNSNEIELVVVWETGEKYIENYEITSLLDSDNLSLRQYHGVTHVMTNLTSGQKEMDLIVLSELIQHLNDPEKSQEIQKTKYSEE
tara:strand:+ start:339761 stop:341776 length:2016 start_codon:yes stop_codon:yes gene_type:complete